MNILSYEQKLALSDKEKRQHFVKALRHMSFLVEHHPEIPSPESFFDFGDPYFIINLRGEQPKVKRQMKEIVRALRKSYFKVEKTFEGENFKVVVPLSPTGFLEISADRSAVCERRVVGTHKEERTIYGARPVEGTETVEVEDVEYDCGSLMGGE